MYFILMNRLGEQLYLVRRLAPTMKLKKKNKATLSHSDKAVAQGTDQSESGNVFLSDQLIALSRGKQLSNQLDGEATSFLETVTALLVKDAFKATFYYELALLVQFIYPPFISEKKTLLLLAKYHENKLDLQSDWENKVYALNSHLGHDSGISFYTSIKFVFEQLQNKPVTSKEFKILIHLSLSKSDGLERTSFWLKFYNRFNAYCIGSEMEELGARKLITLEYVLDRHPLLKGDRLLLLCKFVQAFNINHHHRFLLGKALLNFFKNAYPLLEGQLGKTYYDLKNDTSIKTFFFWLFHNREFHKLLAEQINSECSILFPPNFFRSKSIEAINNFLKIPFYKTISYLPTLILENLNIVDISLLLHLATGKNIRSYPTELIFSKKMAHIFHNLKPTNELAIGSMQKLYLYCFVLSKEGSESLFLFLLRYIDIETENRIGQYRIHIEAFKPYIQKLIKWNICNSLNDYECRLMMAYIAHLLRDQPDFSLKGRTLTSFMRLAHEFHILNTTRYSQHHTTFRSWVGANYNEWQQTDENSGIQYQIIQLTTADELVNESIQLKHCVRTYVKKCYFDQCSIWSLQTRQLNQGWKSLVTIEINRNQEIVQAKAKHNSIPTREQLRMIETWTKQEGIT